MQQNKQIDLGSLTMYDSTQINIQNIDNIQHELTQKMVQNIYFVFQNAVKIKKQSIHAIEILPEEEQIYDFETSKYYFKLPQPSILFPRTQHIPEQKPATKWQKYAKQKGIKKKKKQLIKYDNQLKQQFIRWGGKSKKNQYQVPILQEKQFDKNPFQLNSIQNYMRKQQQKLRNLKNQSFRANHTHQ